MSADDDDRKEAEVVSFEKASHPHLHARKEQKLKKVSKAFRAVSKELFREKRKQKRKNKNKKKR